MEWKVGDIVESAWGSRDKYRIEFINERWVFCLSESKSPEQTYLAKAEVFEKDFRRPVPVVGEVWMSQANSAKVEVVATGPKCVAFSNGGLYRAYRVDAFVDEFRRVP